MTNSFGFGGTNASLIFSKYVKDSHSFWLNLKGNKVKDSDMRKFRIEIENQSK